MPQLGYGVYQVMKDECERCVLESMEKLRTDYLDPMSLLFCVILFYMIFLLFSPAINPVFSRDCREFEISPG